jgi:hypothetical protein
MLIVDASILTTWRLPCRYRSHARVLHAFQFASLSSTYYYDTNMNAIEAALRDLRLDDTLSIAAAARNNGCNRSTLLQRWNGVTKSTSVKAINQQSLSPTQEDTLVSHINRLTRLSIPPTLSMVRNFAAEISKKEVRRA